MSDKWRWQLVVFCLIFGVQSGRAMAEKLGREAIWDEWKGRYIAFLAGCTFFAGLLLTGVFLWLFFLIVIVAMAISALTGGAFKLDFSRIIAVEKYEGEWLFKTAGPPCATVALALPISLIVLIGFGVFRLFA